jgi:type VI secretion system protein ImpE
VRTGPSFKGTELGEVLIPAIYPFSWKDADEAVWLGRLTTWVADEQGREYPSGQKILIADEEEIPLLEIRSLTFHSLQAAQPSAAS